MLDHVVKLAKMEMFAIRRPVAAAIAWTIIAEIVRHHGSRSDFRVLELHPGGGLYDLLTIFRVSGASAHFYEDEAAHEIAGFNLLGTLARKLGGANPRLAWLSLWLQEANPKLTAEAVLQHLALPMLPKRLPTNRRIFGCRLMAALLGSRMLEQDFIDARMGYLDTSGYGAGVQTELRNFTGLYKGRSESPGKGDMSDAADCWLLWSGLERKLIGAVRMDGFLSSAGAPDVAHDLFSLYEGKRKMSTIVAKAHELLGI